jgi:hypothetical protein
MEGKEHKNPEGGRKEENEEEQRKCKGKGKMSEVVDEEV